MKAAAIDSAAPVITVAAQNDIYYAEITLDIGMHQSEQLLPALDYVLHQVHLTPHELEFSALAKGPGSFTGLRLAFSALKALQLSAGCPIYGVPTLDAYVYPYQTWPGAVLAVLDAKKQRFYAAVYRHGIQAAGTEDARIEHIANWLDEEEPLLITGPDAALAAEALTSCKPLIQPAVFNQRCTAAASLLTIGDAMRRSGKAPLAPEEGPLYLRKSEAEESQTAAGNAR